MSAGLDNTVSYLETTRGLRNWLVTLDHKRISLLYLYGVGFMFLLGGLFALLVRTTLLTAGNAEAFAANKIWVSPDNYNRFFTLHGAIMVFICASLGNTVGLLATSGLMNFLVSLFGFA